MLEIETDDVFNRQISRRSDLQPQNFIDNCATRLTSLLRGRLGRRCMLGHEQIPGLLYPQAPERFGQDLKGYYSESVRARIDKQVVEDEPAGIRSGWLIEERVALNSIGRRVSQALDITYRANLDPILIRVVDVLDSGSDAEVIPLHQEFLPTGTGAGE